MTYPRAFANSVVLPNGQVVTMGGQTYAVPFSDANSVLNPELWDPTTGQFTVMAPEAVPRNYHSVAILLPDGTVFSGGGGLCGTCATNHPDGQIFTPPYLLQRRRLAPHPPDHRLRARPRRHRTDDHGDHRRSGVSVLHGALRRGDPLGRQRPAADPAVDRVLERQHLPAGHPLRPGHRPARSLHALRPGRQRHAERLHHHLDHQRRHPAAGQPLRSGGLRRWPVRLLAAQRHRRFDGGRPERQRRHRRTTSAAASPTGCRARSREPGAQGVTLNGSTSQIVASQPITNPTTYSEEMWFKTTTTTGGLPDGLRDRASGTTSTNRDRMVYMANNGQIYFGVYTGTLVTIQSPGSYNDGQWHHVVATQGPDGMHLYVDGQQVAANATAGAQNYLGYWRVGAENLGRLAELANQQLLRGHHLGRGLLQQRAVLQPGSHPLPAVSAARRARAAGRLPVRLVLFGHRGSAARRPADACPDRPGRSAAAAATSGAPRTRSTSSTSPGRRRHGHGLW